MRNHCIFFLLMVCGLLTGCHSGAKHEPAKVDSRKADRVTTPTQPLEMEAIPVDKRTEVQKIDDHTYLMHGVKIDAQKREMVMDGQVNMAGGLIEVLICTPYGKTYESVLVADIRPLDLHAACLLLGMRPGRNPAWKFSTDPAARPPQWDMPPGDKVAIYVQWTTPAGLKETRAEQMLCDSRTGAALPPTQWVFVGSYMNQFGEYIADGLGSIVTNFHDPATVFDLPLEAGQVDDYTVANTKEIPPVGTKVKIRVELAK